MTLFNGAGVNLTGINGGGHPNDDLSVGYLPIRAGIAALLAVATLVGAIAYQAGILTDEVRAYQHEAEHRFDGIEKQIAEIRGILLHGVPREGTPQR